MSESKPQSADTVDLKDLTIGEDRHVNDATLELLEARIKSGVIRNFMKLIGIPLGGGTLIALGTAIFVWFPGHARQAIETHVDKSVAAITTQMEFRENLRQSVESYLESDNGVSIVEAEVENAVRRKMPALVGTHLRRRLPEQLSEQLPEQVGAQLPGLVADTLPGEVKRFLSSDRGADALQSMVVNYLNAGEGRELLIEELSEALEPVVKRISQQVGVNQEARISMFSKTLEKLGRYKKGSYFALDGFLNSPEAQEIAEQGRAIVLTKTIRTGFGYVRDAIHTHIEAFRRAFGAGFLGIAIFDKDERTLVAFVDDRQFADHLDRDSALIELLRAPYDELTREQAVERLREWFGESAVSFVHTDWSLGHALMSGRVWRQPATLDQAVAIVDAGSGHMVAVVSRRELVTGLVD